MSCWRLSQLIAQLGGELVGNDVEVEDFAPLDVAEARHIAFVAQAKFRPQLALTRAGAVVLRPEWYKDLARPCVLTPNPHAWFARALTLMHPGLPRVAGIHPRASVALDAVVDESAEIAAGAVVAAKACIGPRVVLHPGVVIGVGAHIGADTVVYANAVIYQACIVGQRCIIHAGAVIGADGFGFAHDRGSWVKIPQIGRVLIGDDVEVGANTTIDRGALDDTVIGNGVKLDNLIMLAHNLKIGEHTAIAGCVGIAGSTEIGAHCTIGGAAMINGHIVIPDNTHINGGTLLTKSVQGGQTYSGYPFAEARDWARNAAHLRHLDEMARTVQDLQKRLDELERKPLE